MHQDWGSGRYLKGKQFYHLHTPDTWKNVNIAYMEMWALIFAVRALGGCVEGKEGTPMV